MQPDSTKNPNPNPNHQHNHHSHHHRHCTHHSPFPPLHLHVHFCPHHNQYHLPIHLHRHDQLHQQWHVHLHATQRPWNLSLPSSSSPSFPLPPYQTSSCQASQGQEINHATASGVEFLSQEEEEEELEDVFVLTDEWAEFFAKSEAKRQLAKKNKKKGKK